MPRKTLIVLLLIILSMALVETSFAEEENIKLMINSEVITENLDYNIVDNDILVPLNILTDNLDIVVKWFSSINTIQLDIKDKLIKFRIGDRNLQVNNRIVKMSTPAKIIDGQPMIPLKSVGEVLGLIIKSYPKQRLVQILEVKSQLKDIKYNQSDDYERLELLLTEEVDYDIDFLPESERIILDLEGAIFDNKINSLRLESDLVKNIRMTRVNNNSRVIIDLFANVDYTIEKVRVEGKYKYLLKFSPIITDIGYDKGVININSTLPLRGTKVSYLSNPNRVVVDIKNAALQKAQDIKIDDETIKGIRISQFQTKPNNLVRAVIDLKEETRIKLHNKGSKISIIPIKNQLLDFEYDLKHESLVFKLSNKVEPKVFPLTQGDRLVLDFPSTINRVLKNKIAVNNKSIEEVRIAQFDKETTRVVIDLVELVPYDLKWDGNTVQVKLMNKLIDINLKKNKLKTKLNFSLLKPTRYRVYKLINPDRLVIDIFNTMTNSKQIKLPKLGDIVKDIRVSQYSVDPQQQVRVVLELAEEVEFQIKEDISDKIEITLVREKLESNLKDRLIVLDPGHGGHDPGAIGFSGTREKDLVLDIALKLENLLEEAGAKVIMTRNIDQYIELSDRVNIANTMDADIFVSIHLNSHKDKKFEGTETYIRTNYNQTTLLLASLTQRALVNGLKTVDRGVKSNSLHVLDNTNMPAVLNEIAFISNKKEEKVLKTDEFQEEAAISLYKGINNYFRLLAEEED
ncbi:N-acetylmuramoyl-L-alanine amidase [Orenia marismortui]|uniref:N-acetylmuramoyl-L-alanine amidase n=1 Tax=Orenia marismortui TaxID=46469 RepID=UPI000373CD19|nr:N-acetylmuramoyl-L-alanine amidase [Orenia marismortui]